MPCVHHRCGVKQKRTCSVHRSVLFLFCPDVPTQELPIDRHHDFASTVSLAGKRFNVPLASLDIFFNIHTVACVQRSKKTAHHTSSFPLQIHYIVVLNSSRPKHFFSASRPRSGVETWAGRVPCWAAQRAASTCLAATKPSLSWLRQYSRALRQ